MSDTLSTTFEEAIGRVKSLNPDDNTKLELYGLYKVATEGPCTAPRPKSFLGVRTKETAKWDAWNSKSHLTAEDAKTKYVRLVNRI